MKALIKIFSCISILTLASCGSEKESDKIGDAQICLNSATTAATANACLTKIDGITSTAAYAVRCNGSFISEGFASPTKYITAAQSLNGSNNGTTTFMGLITFTSAGSLSTDLTNASNTFTYCLTSGAKGTTLLSSFGYLAMSMYNYARSTGNGATQTACPTTPTASGYNFSSCLTAFAVTNAVSNATAISNMVSSSTSDSAASTLQSSMGSVIVSTYNISCSGSSANQSLCNTLNTAITNAGGVNNTRSVAVQFFQALITP